MIDIKEKTFIFTENISNAYRNEDEKEDTKTLALIAATDVTEDFTAMLLAVYVIYQRITEDKAADLIGFTHLLNRLAVQYTAEKQVE